MVVSGSWLVVSGHSIAVSSRSKSSGQLRAIRIRQQETNVLLMFLLVPPDDMPVPTAHSPLSTPHCPLPTAHSPLPTTQVPVRPA